MKIAIGLIIIALWLYILYVTKRCKLYYGHFLVGSFGFFIFSMVWIRPLVLQPLACVVAAIAGVFGDLTKTFTAFFKYGILFIYTDSSSLTLQIDFECSGIIEIIAFLALLLFFSVYSMKERILLGTIGCIWILLANVVRIIVICELIYFLGADIYFIAHAIIGRIVFYVLSILLYFYVFTKPQIIRTRLGKFSYGNN